MRAVIIATGDCQGGSPLNDRYPSPMLPLVDRPFLQHVIEYLVGQGITVFDFILSHFPEQIEEFIGDGNRWGVQCTFHLARDPLFPYRGLKSFDWVEGQKEPILFGHADRLPLLSIPPTGAVSLETLPLLYYWLDHSASSQALRRWTGWALVAPKDCLALPKDGDEAALLRYFLSLSKPSSLLEVQRPLSVQNLQDLLAAQWTVLEGRFPGLLVAGQETDPGVRVSRNLTLHPTAKLIPPVFIGENCQIHANTSIGPHAVIGHNSVIDTFSSLSWSMVLPGSYVGDLLELENTVVDQDRLAIARPDGSVILDQTLTIASLKGGFLPNWITQVGSMTTGFALLLVAFPVLVVTALLIKLIRKGPVWHGKEVLDLAGFSGKQESATFRVWSFCPPDFDNQFMGHYPPGLADFFLRILPGFIRVATGHLSLVGLPSRSLEEVKKLDPEWQAFYLQAKAGLFTDGRLFNDYPLPEELYALEGVYAVRMGWSTDSKVIISYFGKLLSRMFRRKIIETTVMGPNGVLNTSSMAAETIRI